MTGYNRQQIAEMIQRYVAGGNVSVDIEFYVEEVYPIIDSLVVSYLSAQMLQLGANAKEAINEMWLKKLECQDVLNVCECGQRLFYYDMPSNFLPLPEDGGIYGVRYLTNNCGWDMAQKSTVKNQNTYLPSIVGIMPQAYYLTGNKIYLSKPADKVTIWYLPVTADLEDTDFVALPPMAEKDFQIMLHDYFAGRGNAPKDRMANQMDVKQ